MTYILKKGSLFVIGYDLTEEEGKRPELTRVTLSTKYAMRLPYEIASIISNTIDVEAIAVEDSQKLEELNKFLTKRENKENKLQRIEQLFKSGVVDLEELAKLVKEDK